ncbi:MAG: hypothetical protein WB439_16765, partial [Acidobacteriaceae bacterium]
ALGFTTNHPAPGCRRSRSNPNLQSSAQQRPYFLRIAVALSAPLEHSPYRYKVVISTGAGLFYRPAQWRDLQLCWRCLYSIREMR